MRHRSKSPAHGACAVPWPSGNNCSQSRSDDTGPTQNAGRPASKSDSRGCGRHCRSHRRRPRRASAARSEGRLRRPTGTGARGEADAVPRGAVERAEVAATAKRDCKRWERARRGVFQARDFQKAISSAICRLPLFFFLFYNLLNCFIGIDTFNRFREGNFVR